MIDKRLFLIGLLLLTLVGCRVTYNPCGEWGECIYDEQVAKDYVLENYNVQEILLINCLSRVGIDDGVIENFGFSFSDDDQYGVCIMIASSSNELTYYSYGTTENTGYLDIDIDHTISEMETYIRDNSDYPVSFSGFVLVYHERPIVLTTYFGDFNFDLSQENLILCDDIDYDSCIEIE